MSSWANLIVILRDNFIAVAVNGIDQPTVEFIFVAGDHAFGIHLPQKLVIVDTPIFEGSSPFQKKKKAVKEISITAFTFANI